MSGREREGKRGRRKTRSSFVTGAVALAFLIVGYQVALFLNKAAVSRVLADRSRPDTVYIEVSPSGNGYPSRAGGSPSGNGYSRAGGSPSGNGYSRAGGSPSGNGYAPRLRSGANPDTPVQVAPDNGYDRIYRKAEAKTRTVESFPFDPNTVSVEDLQRLGFSQKQAQAIDNYRMKGGRFRRKSDFADSYVVSDSVYRRLEPHIRIPLTELNSADSAALDNLPGIGGYYARKIIELRDRLGGFSYKEQLMDVPKFDRVRYDELQDLVTVDTSLARPYPLWRLEEDSLKLHPYIGSYAARGIVVFRQNNPREKWTVEELDRAGILKEGMAEKLSRCRIEQ